MTKQLNIFIENSPGRLNVISEKLFKSNIDIRAFTIQDRGDYGLMKLIVNNPEKAYLALADLGCACALKDILAVRIPDKPGNFHTLMKALADNRINVIDAYGFVVQPQNLGVCCMEIENLCETNAADVVQKAGFTLLEDEELYNL
ncbi:MAG: hypothetical protein E4H40_03215 [Candidatus Brocadiia bacterium]|nr:MAG: hypothetical protein E4H40_03215 [Candidatus Brocadiia bacterium]